MSEAPSSARPTIHASSVPSVSASHWTALRWYSVSRVVLAALLLVASWGYDGRVLIDIDNPGRFRSVAFVYLVLGIGYLATIRWGKPQFRPLRDLQLLTDLVAIVLLMSVAGGIRGGLGVLIVASVAAAAVISNARTSAVYAAAGTLALLAETGLRSWWAGTLDPSESLLAGLFGLACFLVAIAVNTLAGRLSQQEALANRRGEDLRNQLAVTQRVIAELDIGVVVVSAQGKVRTMNRAAQQMVGRPGNPFERVPGGGAPTLERVLGPAWRGLQALYLNWREQSGATPYMGEFTPLAGAPGGEPMPKLRLRLMRARENDDSDAVLLIEDIRELELRAQQLKLASMGRLSASIAHEIRNPLAAIRHANGLLGEGLAEPNLRRLSSIIEDNTVRIDRTIEDVLSLSRRDRSGDESLDMARFLPAFAAEFVRQAGVDPRRLAVSAPSTGPIAFDSNHLRRVLANLVGNALRYASQAAGAVSIEWAETAGDRLELRIMDDGPGMSEEALRHAFEPFFTTEGRGTGLGLYLARELCGANGAGIRYERGGSGRYGGGFVIEPRPAGSDAIR
ncbi:MAG: HAMP domain-containing sensor histidine kinase [Burkholderiaceae bacterium]